LSAKRISSPGGRRCARPGAPPVFGINGGERMPAKRSVWVGHEPRETEASRVLVYSLLRQARRPVSIHHLVLDDVVARGLYDRPTERRDGKLYDLLSATDYYDGAMSTEFAISRFLTPKLAREGLALFMDCDMLPRCDINEVFDHVEREQAAGQDRALWCVQHPNYRPAQKLKMDGQQQTYYGRKNWTSFMVFNCEHRANQALTLELINNRPGRDLHALCWLTDAMIGALPAAYNHLVGEHAHSPDAKVVHFTNGGPWMEGYESVPFADAWRAERGAMHGATSRKQA
jgi:hypothetical protein